MNNIVYSPSFKFREYVFCYIIMDNDFSLSEQDIEMNIYPNGLSAIAFTFGDQYLYQNHYGDVSNLNVGAMVIGIHEEVFKLRPTKLQKKIIITFKPGILGKLLNTPMNKLRNKVVPLDYFMKCGNYIPELLSKTTTVQQQINIVEQWLMQKISKIHLSNDITNHVFSHIISYSGDIKIAEICKEYKINIKYIERKFQENFGISPKKHSEIVKFNLIIKLMLSHPHTPWSELCVETGFIDYSHLSKHTNKISKLYPKNLKQKLYNAHHLDLMSNIDLGVINSLCILNNHSEI